MPYTKKKKSDIYAHLTDTVDKPISAMYPAIDTDLARDNVENDLPAGDLEDL